jgi:hypothetical protein
VGDYVFLKVKTNRSSLRLGSCAKLATSFCGPFEILERIGPVAYMLALPASMTVHNVFHVSLLKKNKSKNRVYVPNVRELKLTIIKEMHNVAYAGHPGYQNTVAAVKSHYFWPGLKKEIVEYIARCMEC